MLNIEKYRDEILEIANQNENIAFDLEYNHVCACDFILCCDCLFKKCEGKCEKARYEWLLSEYKEQILTKAEREYLSAVCKPYQVVNVTKYLTANGCYNYIRIKTDSALIYLPNFQRNTMYKGMELNKTYTPQELGITCKNNKQEK